MALGKSFEPTAVESRWYAHWESSGWFAAGANNPGDGNAPAYCIQLPPPNVTGTLHMGHAFQQTLMDALIRYHRMRGFNTNWVVGTDHAGIATQIVVERQLQERGQDAPRPGPRRLRRARLGMEAGVRRHHHAPDAAPRRIGATGPTPTPRARRPATSPWTRRCRAPWWRCSSDCTKKA